MADNIPPAIVSDIRVEAIRVHACLEWTARSLADEEQAVVELTEHGWRVVDE